MSDSAPVTDRELQSLVSGLHGVRARLSDISPSLTTESARKDAAEHSTRLGSLLAKLEGKTQLSQKNYRTCEDVRERAEIFTRRAENEQSSRRAAVPVPPSAPVLQQPVHARSSRIQRATSTLDQEPPKTKTRSVRAPVSTDATQGDHEVQQLNSKMALSLPLLRRWDKAAKFALPLAPGALGGAVVILAGHLVLGLLVLLTLVLGVVLSQQLRVQLRDAERVVARRVEDMVATSKEVMAQAAEMVHHAENDVMATEIAVEKSDSDVLAHIENWCTQLPDKPASWLRRIRHDAEPLLMPGGAQLLDPMQQMEWDNLLHQDLVQGVEHYLSVYAQLSGDRLKSEQRTLMQLLRTVHQRSVQLTDEVAATIRAQMSRA